MIISFSIVNPKSSPISAAVSKSIFWLTVAILPSSKSFLTTLVATGLAVATAVAIAAV